MSLKFSKREKMIFYALILILAVYAVYVVLYQFFWMNLSDVKRQTMNAEQHLLILQTQQRKLSENLKSQGAALDDFRQNGSDGSVRTKMQAALQGIAAREGVRIIDMKPMDIKTQDLYKEFPVSMMLEGSFLKIMRFLYFVESSQYGFKIKEFRFSKSYAAVSELRCQVVLSQTFLNSKT